jgi:hypothetical protein
MMRFQSNGNSRQRIAEFWWKMWTANQFAFSVSNDGLGI